MSIRVEFYGIPRQRAGVAATSVEAGPDGSTLSQLLAAIAAAFPDLADACIGEQALHAGYTASINGERFVTDPDAVVPSGAALLIMSTDAGG